MGRLAQHRLLTFDHDPATGKRTVELAHEALIREWGRLRGWIDEGRADLRQQRLLSASAAEWRAAGEERSYLLSGSRLAQFEDWATSSRITLTAEERHYLEASIAEHQRQRRWRWRMRRAILSVAVSVSILMALLALAALQARGTAQEERNHARITAEERLSLALAAGAREAASDNNPDLALALAAQAVSVPHSLPQTAADLADIAFSPGTRRVLTGHTSPIEALAVSADGKYLLTGSGRVIPFVPVERDNSMRL